MLKRFLLPWSMVFGILALLAPTASAAPFDFSTSISGNQDFVGSFGSLYVPDLSTLPSVVLSSSYSASDTINFTVNGTVDLSTGENGVGYQTNAAGITVNSPNSFFGNDFGLGTSLSSYGWWNLSSPFGSLVVSNDGFSSYHTLFSASAANGLGSAAPPSFLSATYAVGDLFSSGLAAGSTLNFMVMDTDHNNSGGFWLSGSISVPEPSITRFLHLL